MYYIGNKATSCNEMGTQWQCIEMYIEQTEEKQDPQDYYKVYSRQSTVKDEPSVTTGGVTDPCKSMNFQGQTVKTCVT